MNFLGIDDIDDLDTWVSEARKIKESPLMDKDLGAGRTLGLLFFNPSLRTRLSTQKAAQNLGLNCMVMNFDKEGWALEYADGVVMDQGKSEHIREAARVISQFCDIIAIRAFASLEDRERDEAEVVLEGFKKYATVPIVNMESSTAHPLQALADAITLDENGLDGVERKKVVLTWAPHPKASCPGKLLLLPLLVYPAGSAGCVLRRPQVADVELLGSVAAFQGPVRFVVFE